MMEADLDEWVNSFGPADDTWPDTTETEERIKDTYQGRIGKIGFNKDRIVAGAKRQQMVRTHGPLRWGQFSGPFIVRQSVLYAASVFQDLRYVSVSIGVIVV